MDNQSYNEKTKKALNEIAKENEIFDEIQIGPQEEPIVHEFKVDIPKYRRYIRKKSQMNRLKKWGSIGPHFHLS